MTATAQTHTVSPVTADTALFTFYDIESLSNVFTLCAYTPRGNAPGALEVFYLVDDQADGSNLADLVDPKELGDRLFASNPGLPAYPATRPIFFDLRREDAVMRLAQLIGLSSTHHVGDPDETSAYPPALRPVCDTDAGYDPRQRHPFLAGYNSMNYDTTMLALYFSEVFAGYEVRQDRINTLRKVLATGASAQDVADARVQLQRILASTPALRRVSAAAMREHNNKLFSDEHIEYMPGALGWDSPAARIRRSMLNSGRHLDVSRLNELQFKVALKRLLGMLGRQIKESEKLGHDSVITTVEEFYELLAYNVSDCLGLSQLFRHPAYASNFDLKAGLLAQYSETVFAADGSVRRDRLAIDSSSAKFVGRILAPYAPLQDIEAVSYLYPAEEVAEDEHVAQVDVLEECVCFFEEHIAPDPADAPEATAAQKSAHAQFMKVVEYYRSIRGQNFNDSEEYADVHDLPVRSLRDIPKAANNVPYFNADATPSSCFATFSTGGIHGAEADIAAFVSDQDVYVEQMGMLVAARRLFPDAKDFLALARSQHSELRLPDGSTVDKRLVLLGSDPAKVRYRKPKNDDPVRKEQIARAQAQVPDPADLLAAQRPESAALDVVLPDGTVLEGKVVLAETSPARAAYRDEPPKKKPHLFTTREDGSNKLHPKYARTSAGLVVHEDFTSYYPNLLRNMRAFYNPGLGEDRYATIFFEKERLGRELKTPGITPEEKARLKTLRNGTKLILNSASGAGDASHRTPIRMNNRIISMRIIGQLFSWRIGQAQTLAGARIISTNTDGLYSIVGGDNGFDEHSNNAVLDEQKVAIGIAIEPELMFLISKDSNNRLELTAPEPGNTVADSQIIAAGGGTLACHAGPTPTKSLAHPAVIDFALARYLQRTAGRGEKALAEDFDPDLGRRILREALDPTAPVRTLLLFQNVIAASRGSITYPFAADPLDPDTADCDIDTDQLVRPQALQMVNRVFIVRPGTPGAVSLHNAGAWKVPPASAAKRRQEGRRPERNQVAEEILRHHGWVSDGWKARRHGKAPQGLNQVPSDQDIVVRKINGIDPRWSMVINNDDLHAADPRVLDELIRSLDLEVYTRMLDETFTKNWQNQYPG